MADKGHANSSLRKRKPGKVEHGNSNSSKGKVACEDNNHDVVHDNSSGEEVTTGCVLENNVDEACAENVSNVDAMDAGFAIKESRVHHFCIFLFSFGSLALRLYNIDIPAHIW